MYQECLAKFKTINYVPAAFATKNWRLSRSFMLVAAQRAFHKNLTEAIITASPQFMFTNLKPML
jgi:hypothetical protein